MSNENFPKGSFTNNSMFDKGDSSSGDSNIKFTNDQMQRILTLICDKPVTHGPSANTGGRFYNSNHFFNKNFNKFFFNSNSFSNSSSFNRGWILILGQINI